MAISPKEDAIRAIAQLPDDATTEEIAYTMYVRAKVERGLRDIESGRVSSHAEMKNEMAAWRESIGQQMQAGTTETSSKV